MPEILKTIAGNYQPLNTSGGKIILYLADLTHTGLQVAANVHPYGIGLIAANVLKHLGDRIEVSIFKNPKALSDALMKKPPTVIAFANYSWNCTLAHAFANRIKAAHPETVVVIGGPNYGLSEQEQEDYWARHPMMDFYVVKEGEVAMVALLNTLDRFHFDVSALKREGTLVPSCHYLMKGRICRGQLLPRIQDLNDVPSPYLSGLMDKFFDDVLIPLTGTSRGCPFSCTYCQEGASYYDKVTRRSDFREELEYMANRIGTVPDLILSNANFGMLNEDLAHARTIAAIQDKYGWPKHVIVSGGKNRKAQLIEAAAIMRGTMNLAASLQSTDRTVLANVKRSNISLGQLHFVSCSGSRLKANAYTELILGLPGDSWNAHANSLRDSVNAGLGYVRIFQLIMLPDTDINKPETRKRFGMTTKFRVMPRCFGTYALFGESFASVEVEEICVSQDSMSFEDYLRCRELDLTVEIVHNLQLFKEIFGLLHHLELPWFDLLMRFHERRMSCSSALANLYATLREDTIKSLWNSWEDAQTFAKGNLSKYLFDELATNELLKAKVVAFYRLQNDIRDAVYREVEHLLHENGRLCDVFRLYLSEVKSFSQLRIGASLNTTAEAWREYHFDFDAIVKRGYDIDPREYLVDTPLGIRFTRSEAQRKEVEGYISQYGTNSLALGRCLMRAHIKSLSTPASPSCGLAASFRNDPQPQSESSQQPR